MEPEIVAELDEMATEIKNKHDEQTLRAVIEKLREVDEDSADLLEDSLGL